MFTLFETLKQNPDPFKYKYLQSLIFSRFIYFNAIYAGIIWFVAPTIYCRANQQEEYHLCREIQICHENADYYIGKLLI